jgi:hypothetical protein
MKPCCYYLEKINQLYINLRNLTEILWYKHHKPNRTKKKEQWNTDFYTLEHRDAVGILHYSLKTNYIINEGIVDNLNKQQVLCVFLRIAGEKWKSCGPHLFCIFSLSFVVFAKQKKYIIYIVSLSLCLLLSLL